MGLNRFSPLAFMAVLALAGCYDAPPEQARPLPEDIRFDPAGPRPAPEVAARNFMSVVARMEPIVEDECRARTRGIVCDFNIVVDDRAGQPPNAYQTLDRTGRPIIAFTVPLIAEARNQDELAFILGHEAAHHIEKHIPRQSQQAMAGALLGGVLAAASGADASAIRSAQDVGATIGARRYSKDFELEADELGTVIAYRAGYDPLRGAAFFDRIPDPGNRFLGTHPPNADRIATVRRTLASLR
ncbi:M48 family metallopeptidase [Ostreiculturibacter nitratireducens]|uniref:M48 family metallopeptidase n=1 Tax=Ostreiculturibacter nitratireducens TaxID=3075226 RepID=UPI0031B59777